MERLAARYSFLTVLIVGVLGAWRAVAQQQVPGELFGRERLPGPPILVGGTNCVAQSVWRVKVSGGDPRTGEHVLFFGSRLNLVPETQVAIGPVGPDGSSEFDVDITPFQVHGTISSWEFSAKERRRLPSGQVLESDFSTWSLRDPSTLPAPEVAPQPVWTCGKATGGAGHQPGDRVELYSSTVGTKFVLPKANGTYDYLGDFTGFTTGEKVEVRYFSCAGDPSPPSPSVTATEYPGQLPKPRLPLSGLVSGVALIPVLGVQNGARITARIGRLGTPQVVFSRTCIGREPCFIEAPASFGGLFSFLDTISVKQDLCDGQTGAEVVSTVNQCDSSRPLLFFSPRDQDTQLIFSEYPAGSWLIAKTCLNFDAFINVCRSGWVQVGEAFNSRVVNLSRPLRSGQYLAVSQQVDDACPPIQASLYVVR